MMKPSVASGYSCLHCGKRYISARNLYRHTSKHHGVVDNYADTVAQSDRPIAFNANQLKKSLPFFVNSRGRYQFNANENKRHVNCPFCVLHRTSLYGLAKHCALRHSRQYLAWRAGQYGRIQLRSIPPNDSDLRSAMQTLVDAGILTGDIQLEGADGLPQLPPCPPLIDCRGLGRLRELEEQQQQAAERYEGDSSWRSFDRVAGDCAAPYYQPTAEAQLAVESQHRDGEESFVDYYQRQTFSYQQPGVGAVKRCHHMCAQNFPFGPQF